VKGKILVWPLLAVLALASVAQAVRWRDRRQASRSLYIVEARTRAAIQAGSASRRLFADNLSELERAARLAPAEVGIPLARGTQYLLRGSYDSAVSAYQEALRQEPRPEIYLNLGRAQYAAGQRDEAGESFAKAVQLDPRLAEAVPKQ
jgi:tetratricopeptide (TPR) repeat protein